MKCRSCNSNNVFVQAVNQDRYVRIKKHRGIFYWLFFGWLIDLFMWTVFPFFKLISRFFGPKVQVFETTTQAICQNCGCRWEIRR